MSEGNPIKRIKEIFHKSGKPDYEKKVVPSIFFTEFSKLPLKDRERSLRSMGKDVRFFFDSGRVEALLFLFGDDIFLMDGKKYCNVTFSSQPLRERKRIDEREKADIRDTVDVLFTQEQFQDLSTTYWGLSGPVLSMESGEWRPHNLRIPIYSLLDLRVIKVSEGPKRLKGRQSFLFKGVILPIEEARRSLEERFHGISRGMSSNVNVRYSRLDDLKIVCHAEHAEKNRYKTVRR